MPKESLYPNKKKVFVQTVKDYLEKVTNARGKLNKSRVCDELYTYMLDPENVWFFDGEDKFWRVCVAKAEEFGNDAGDNPCSRKLGRKWYHAIRTKTPLKPEDNVPLFPKA